MSPAKAMPAGTAAHNRRHRRRPPRSVWMTSIAAAPTHSRWNARVRPSTRSADLANTLAAPHMTTATSAPRVPAADGDGLREGDAVVEGRALLKRATEGLDDL